MKSIKLGRWQFSPTLWPSLGAAVVVALTMRLGDWQTGRAQEKLALQEALDLRSSLPAAMLPSKPVLPEDYIHRRVQVRGHFVEGRTLFIDNRVYKGRPGYHVVTAFQIAGEELFVGVNRGWVPGDPRRERLPQVPTSSEEQVLDGIAEIPKENTYQLAPETSPGNVKQHLSMKLLAEQWGIPLQPVIVQQTSDGRDGLVRDWARPDSGVDTHRAYAFQWYALALVTIVLWISLNLGKTNASQ